MAEFFHGWGKMFRLRDSIIFNSHHLLWSLIFFWASILNWYMLWKRIPFIEEGFFYFALILLPVLLLYISVVILFPDLEEKQDLNVYYQSNKRILILLFSIQLFINISIGIFLGELDWHVPINLVRGFISLFGIICIAFNWKGIHDLLVYVYLISIIIGTIIISSY